MKKLFLFLALISFFLCALPLGLMAEEQSPKLIPFKGYDLDGKAIDLGDSLAKKPIMIIFWASWCPVCEDEIPKLNELVKKFQGRGMEFIGVNIGVNDSYKRAKAFSVRTKMDYPTLFDATGTIGEQYMVQGVPTMVLADKNGVIRFYGHATPEISEENFARLLAE